MNTVTLSIVEGNRLIAEFMGLKANPYDNGLTYGINAFLHENGKDWLADDWVRLKYHSSWDWLMPVVEKIGTLNYEFDISTHYGIEVSQFPMQSVFAIDKDDFDEKMSLKNLVWQAVVQFIQWYNNQTKQS